jgi:hypothetical protein
MPVELIRMILAGVPDVRSLHSAIVSCPLFYLTFLDVESEITPQVLLNQIDETVLPEALAALETFALLDISRPFYGGTEWHESKGIALKSRDISCRPTSLRGTIRLSQLHENVRYFADIFIDRNLSVGPLNRVHKPITHQERCRIERAFYRFDIYCAYFRPPLPADRSGRVMASRYLSPLGPFQEQFTPWEMEQLSCICHFMARELLRRESLILSLSSRTQRTLT